jgi:predicted O-methyltransferase YrrM
METGYTFEYDWFSGNIPIFEKHLSRYKGEPCRFLEIGSHEGRSATWLLDNVLTHPAAHLNAIDLVIQNVLVGNLQKSGGDKTTLHEGVSCKLLRTFTFESFDFVYVDGSHTAIDVLEDAVLSFRLLKNGGIMAFDDYLWHEERHSDGTYPKAAIDAFLSVYGHRFRLLEKGFQVWIQKVA